MSSLAASLVNRAAEQATQQGKALCGALHEMYERITCFVPHAQRFLTNDAKMHRLEGTRRT
jgi:hypothetical protein